MHSKYDIYVFLLKCSSISWIRERTEWKNKQKTETRDLTFKNGNYSPPSKNFRKVDIVINVIFLKFIN